jgi:pilus assembly protein Flp/PilA
MSQPASRWRRFLADDSGATSIEYALIASIAAVAALVALHLLSTAISDMFIKVANTVGTAGSGS